MTSSTRTLPGRQDGVALLVGLVILVVLALLGISAYSLATQDERIAGNARDRSRAMDAAETALRECELAVQVPGAFGGATAGLYPAPTAGATLTALWKGDDPSFTWSNANTYLLPTAKQTAFSDEATAPRCIAEQFAVSNTCTNPNGCGNNTINVARITAKGYGFNSGTVVTLVSYFAYY